MSKIALILGPYVHFTAAGIARVPTAFVIAGLLNPVAGFLPPRKR